jgi:hypothetical protein
MRRGGLSYGESVRIARWRAWHFRRLGRRPQPAVTFSLQDRPDVRNRFDMYQRSASIVTPRGIALQCAPSLLQLTRTND